MEQRLIDLKESSVVAEDVEKRIKTVGIRGLDIEKARELGLFTRISNLLCAVHASVMAAYRIYGGVDYLLSEFGGRKNEINREMNIFEKWFTRFINFWTGYYAHGEAGKEVNEETEVLYRHIMEWAQLPFEWNLGDNQHTEDETANSLSINVDGKEYTFKETILDGDVLSDVKESWCVTKYDVREHKQTTVEENMDKASAIMVAKRLSMEDSSNIYTASIVREYTQRLIDVTPYRAYKENETIGKITKIKK